VVNIGDMLERLSRGVFRSTPHRVRNASGRDRLSFPLFFDPSWDAVVAPIEGIDPALAAAVALDADADRAARWDGASVHADVTGGGPYGAYLLAKVSKVFPWLRDDVL
jgi:isopenicillin N synthase-like dioxygenase